MLVEPVSSEELGERKLDCNAESVGYRPSPARPKTGRGWVRPVLTTGAVPGQVTCAAGLVSVRGVILISLRTKVDRLGAVAGC
eukprot:scaffold1780_cov93-Isochrysis_galbana.AAC.1